MRVHYTIVYPAGADLRGGPMGPPPFLYDYFTHARLLHAKGWHVEAKAVDFLAEDKGGGASS